MKRIILIIGVIIILLLSSCGGNNESVINQTKYVSNSEIVDTTVYQNNDDITDKKEVVDDVSGEFSIKFDDDILIWRGEKIESETGNFFYGLHELDYFDNIDKLLENQSKNVTPTQSEKYHKVKFKHCRFETDFDVSIYYSKVNIIYSDEVDKKMIIFSWDDTKSEDNLSQILKNVRGCKIVLPIGYNIKDI